MPLGYLSDNLLSWDFTWLWTNIPVKDVANIFRLKNAWDQGQVLLLKCSFQDKMFDTSCFKCSTVIVDRFLPNWSIFGHLFPVSKIYSNYPKVAFDYILKKILFTVSYYNIYIYIYIYIYTYIQCHGSLSATLGLMKIYKQPSGR